MITVKVTDSGIKEAMTRISRRMADPSPVMLAISEALKDQVAENFATQSGPLGKWPPLKYKRKGRGTNPQLLQHSGRLRDSVHPTHTRNTAVIGTNVVYAAIHQFGGTINMPARSQLSYFKQDKRGSVGRLFVRKDARTTRSGTHAATAASTCPHAPSCRSPMASSRRGWKA